MYVLWRRRWQPTPVFLPRKSHGQRSLEGYIVHRVAKESDTTQQLNKNNKVYFNLRNGIISYKIFCHLLLCCEKFLILLISFMNMILNGCKGIPSKECAVNYLTNPQLWVINFVSKQRIWHPAKLLLIYEENMPLNTFLKNEKNLKTQAQYYI